MKFGFDDLRIDDGKKKLGAFKASLELYSNQGNVHELWHHGKGSSNVGLSVRETAKSQ